MDPSTALSILHFHFVRFRSGTCSGEPGDCAESSIHATTACLFTHILPLCRPAARRQRTQGTMLAMETARPLSRLEIPGTLPPTDFPSLSPALRSAAVSLPRLSPVGEDSEEQQQSAIENTVTDPDTNAPFLSTAISPTYIDSHIPPTVRTHVVSPAFHSRSTSASSAELLVPGSDGSPLMRQEFEHTHAPAGRSTYNGIFSPRSFLTVSSRSSIVSPRTSSPPSATALSASQLHPPLQIGALRPRRRSTSGSTTAVPTTPGSRPRHSLYYMSDEMIILEVSIFIM